MQSVSRGLKTIAHELASKYSVSRKSIENALEAERAAGNDFEQRASIVEEALFYLKQPNQALSIFESETWPDVVKRANAYRELSDVHTPLYGFDELQEHLLAFRDHLKDNRDHLLEYGLPETSYSRSPWLDTRLTNLYFTKLPKQVSAVPEGESYKYTYEWPKKDVAHHRFARQGQTTFLDTRLRHASTVRTLFGTFWSFKRRTPQGDTPVSGSHDSPVYLAGLQRDVADQITSIRPRLLDSKIHVLFGLAEAIASQDDHLAKALCENVLSTLTLFDPQAMVLEIENLYQQKSDTLSSRYGYRSTDIRTIDAYHGGITNLLRVIGHVRVQLKIGTMSKIHARLEGQLSPHPPTHGSNLREFSYFQLMEKANLGAIDEILSDYMKKHNNELSAWSEIREWIWPLVFGIRQSERGYPHSSDFSECAGVQFSRGRQRHILEVLYNDWELGHDEPLPERIIFKRITSRKGVGYRRSRVRDAFQRSNGDWQTIIIKPDSERPEYYFRPPSGATNPTTQKKPS